MSIKEIREWVNNFTEPQSILDITDNAKKGHDYCATLLKMVDRECVWVLNGIEGNRGYKLSCGGSRGFIERFCPNCGGKVALKETE